MSRDVSGPLQVDRLFYLFENYCDNYSDIVKSEGVTKSTFGDFMENKVCFGFPNKTRFRLVNLKGQDKYVPVDSGICRAIVHLNERGYTTKYCCEGHGHGNGYIYFELLDEEKSNALVDKFVSLAENKVIKLVRESINGKLIFRFSPLNCNYINMLKELEKELISLE